MEKEVIDYLTGLGFEIQPCSVPLNDKEYFKRDLFVMIGRKSNFLFRLLRKWFPIKYKSEREDKSIWFILRDEITRKSIYEIELKPSSDEHIRSMRFHYDNFDYSKWTLRVCSGPSFAFLDGDDFFYLYGDPDQGSPIEEIEYHFNQIPELKQLIRQKKLELVLNG